MKPWFTFSPIKSPVTTTHIQDLILAEAESLGLFGGWESRLEGLTSRRSCGCVSVTLRQNPVTHQALQKGGQAATHFQHQLLKGLLGALPYAAIVVLIDIKTKFSSFAFTDIYHVRLSGTMPHFNIHVYICGEWAAHHWYFAVNSRPVWQDPFNLLSIPFLAHGPKVLHSLKGNSIKAHPT